MAHLYLDETLSQQLGGAEASGESVRVRGAEARHAATVSRVRVGEQLRLGDGAGLVVHGVVTAVVPDELTVAVDRVERYERPSPSIRLVQALAKGDRDELAVQMATEVGVDGIVPWQAARSVSRWDAAKAVRNRERWQTIAREATKQALRPWMPDVESLASTQQLVERAATSTVLVLDPTAAHALSALTASEIGHGEVLIVVGPEGGVTPDERAALVNAGARAVRLGPTVVRTSTAGPAAITVLQVALGRW